MNKYGSFIWFGTHLSMTQTNWHYLLETFLCIIVNFLILFSLYLQYKDEQYEKLQKTNNPQ
jgi:Na+/H+ antiporter NhaD/arsenite permease-like protein